MSGPPALNRVRAEHSGPRRKRKGVMMLLSRWFFGSLRNKANKVKAAPRGGLFRWQPTSPERERSSRRSRSGEGPAAGAEPAQIAPPRPLRRGLALTPVCERRIAALRNFLRWVPDSLPLRCAPLQASGKELLRGSRRSLHGFPGRMQRSGMRPGTQRNKLPRSGAISRVSQRSPFRERADAAESRAELPPSASLSSPWIGFGAAAPLE